MDVKKISIKSQQPPCTWCLKLLHGPIGTYGKGKKIKRKDCVLIMVKVCSTVPKMNPPMTFQIKLIGNFVLLTTTFNLRSIF